MGHSLIDPDQYLTTNTLLEMIQLNIYIYSIWIWWRWNGVVDPVMERWRIGSSPAGIRFLLFSADEKMFQFVSSDTACFFVIISFSIASLSERVEHFAGGRARLCSAPSSSVLHQKSYEKTHPSSWWAAASGFFFLPRCCYYHWLAKYFFLHLFASSMDMALMFMRKVFAPSTRLWWSVQDHDNNGKTLLLVFLTASYIVQSARAGDCWPS